MDIFIKDFAHLVKDGDYTLAVAEAVRECKRHETSRLIFDKGTYDFYKKYAFQKEYFISNNDYGLKSIIFPLIGAKNLTIDGGGAEFIMHGEILPFVIDQSANVTCRDFSVDYPRPFFSQAKIIASQNGHTDLEFDTDKYPCRVENEAIVFYSNEPDYMPEEPTYRVLGAEFDVATGAPSAYISPYLVRFSKIHKPSFLDSFTRYATAQQISKNVIRLNGIDNHTVGNYWATTHAKRDNPGIFINESENTTLENINLYHTAAMGVIGQISENITLKNVNTVVRPGSGRYISVSADSTHFVNCSGQIDVFDCTFTNMLDDAGNFHGIYTTVNEILGKNTMLLEFRHEQQRGIMIYKKGDTIALVEPSTLATFKELTIKEASWHSGDLVRIETVEDFPEGLAAGHAVENFSRMPSVHIKGCVTGNNRPRGFLITTNKKSIIEDCTFFNMMCGLHFTGDANDWFESGPVRDVIVRNNNFKNSSYVGGAAIAIDPAVREKKNNYYHSGIVIEDNTFEMHEKRFLSVHNAKDIIFRNNVYIQNSSMPSHPQIGANGISFTDCKNCVIEEPSEE
ncbi:MAG: right-handed parallel beta-helix repeat-containing protein [Saccharofermentanales bacterium]